MYTSLWTNAIEDPDRNTIAIARKTEKALDKKGNNYTSNRIDPLT